MELQHVDRDFGIAVRENRLRQGMHQEALSESVTRLGYPLSQATIGKIERGERKVTIGEALAIGDALALDLTWIIPKPNSPRFAARALLGQFETAKTSVRSSLESMLHSALALQALVTAHPELARELDSSLMAAPEPDEVLDWLAAHVAYDLEQEFEDSTSVPLRVDSEERKAATVAIAEALAAGMLVVGPPPTDQG